MKDHIVVYILIVIISITVFANSFPNSFVFDDESLVRDNYSIRSLKNIPKILGFTTVTPSYRPLRTVTYTLDYFVFGLRPWGFRLFNIFYHSVSALLIFLILIEFKFTRPISLLATILFVVHPINTDTVTYISGRRDLLVGLFYFLGFYSYIKFQTTKKNRWIILTLVSYYLGFLSKEMIITLPIIFIIYDYFIDNCKERFSLTIIKNYKLYLTFLIITSLSLYHIINGRGGELVNSTSGVRFYGDSFLITLQTIPWLLLNYLKILFFPITLLVDYSFNAMPLIYSLTEWRGYASFTIISALFIVVIKTNNNFFRFAIIWFFITLIPVMQIVPHPEIFAIHYLYIPLFSFTILFAIILSKIKNRNIMLLISLITILLFSTRTIIRNLDWKTTYSLYSKNLQNAPLSVRSRITLANYLIDNNNDYRQALILYKQALSIDSLNSNYSLSHIIYKNLGIAYRKTKEYDKAKFSLNKSMEISPTEDIFIEYALLYLDLKQYNEVKNYLDFALTVYPNSQTLKGLLIDTKNTLRINENN